MGWGEAPTLSSQLGAFDWSEQQPQNIPMEIGKPGGQRGRLLHTCNRMRMVWLAFKNNIIFQYNNNNNKIYIIIYFKKNSECWTAKQRYNGISPPQQKHGPLQAQGPQKTAHGTPHHKRTPISRYF